MFLSYFFPWLSLPTFMHPNPLLWVLTNDLFIEPGIILCVSDNISLLVAGELKGYLRKKSNVLKIIFSQMNIGWQYRRARLYRQDGRADGRGGWSTKKINKPTLHFRVLINQYCCGASQF